MTICYTGFRNDLEVKIGYFELECIIDAIKEYKAKYQGFDPLTTDCFDTLQEVLDEQEEEEKK